MLLSSVLDQLEVGELAQIALTERVDGEITEENKKALVTHVNMGLAALHKRFVFQENSLVLTLQPDKFKYVLNRKFAASNTTSTEPVKYIADLDDPFVNTVMQIEAVTDEMGNDLSLNSSNRVQSLKTTSFNTLVLPHKIKGYAHVLDNNDTLSVIYRPNPKALGMLDLAYPANMVEVDLPETHLEPLLYYIASRVLNPIGMSDTFHAGNNYAAKYEASCQQLLNEGFGLSETGHGGQFSSNGWV